MSKARKEAAKKKSIAQKAATRANKLQSATEQIGGPESAQELFARGATALNNEEFTTSIELLRQAIRLNPQHVDSFVSLGLAYANLGQHDFALAACEMALQLDREHPVALENRRFMLNAMGLPDSTVVKP